MTDAYELYVSYNAGITYSLEREANSLDELRPRMAELDASLLRWYVDKNGEPDYSVSCGIHSAMLSVIQMLRSEEPHT